MDFSAKIDKSRQMRPPVERHEHRSVKVIETPKKDQRVIEIENKLELRHVAVNFGKKEAGLKTQESSVQKLEAKGDIKNYPTYVQKKALDIKEQIQAKEIANEVENRTKIIQKLRIGNASKAEVSKLENSLNEYKKKHEGLINSYPGLKEKLNKLEVNAKKESLEDWQALQKTSIDIKSAIQKKDVSEVKTQLEKLGPKQKEQFLSIYKERYKEDFEQKIKQKFASTDVKEINNILKNDKPKVAVDKFAASLALHKKLLNQGKVTEVNAKELVEVLKKSEKSRIEDINKYFKREYASKLKALDLESAIAAYAPKKTLAQIANIKSGMFDKQKAENISHLIEDFSKNKALQASIGVRLVKELINGDSKELQSQYKKITDRELKHDLIEKLNEKMADKALAALERDKKYLESIEFAESMSFSNAVNAVLPPGFEPEADIKSQFDLLSERYAFETKVVYKRVVDQFSAEAKRLDEELEYAKRKEEEIRRLRDKKERERAEDEFRALFSSNKDTLEAYRKDKAYIAKQLSNVLGIICFIALFSYSYNESSNLLLSTVLSISCAYFVRVESNKIFYRPKEDSKISKKNVRKK